jgi:uncharacterized protein with ParB-like and HNH nuclease domain
MKCTNYKEIPKYTDSGSYVVYMEWHHIERWLSDQQTELKLDIDPDFQRAHVWTEAQQISYVEFSLRGGQGCNELKFNCTGWMDNFSGPFVLVDGKQRLNAVLRFLRNEIPAFGTYYKDYTDNIARRAHFNIRINDLDTKAKVLQWYLELNSSGVIHTEEDLDLVRNLLEAEKCKSTE